MMERRCVEESMMAAIAIVLKQLPGNSKYLPVLLRSLDSATPFYAGMMSVIIEFYDGKILNYLLFLYFCFMV